MGDDSPEDGFVLATLVDTAQESPVSRFPVVRDGSSVRQRVALVGGAGGVSPIDTSTSLADVSALATELGRQTSVPAALDTWSRTRMEAHLTSECERVGNE